MDNYDIEIGFLYNSELREVPKEVKEIFSDDYINYLKKEIEKRPERIQHIEIFSGRFSLVENDRKIKFYGVINISSHEDISSYYKVNGNIILEGTFRYYFGKNIDFEPENVPDKIKYKLLDIFKPIELDMKNILRA